MLTGFARSIFAIHIVRTNNRGQFMRVAQNITKRDLKLNASILLAVAALALSHIARAQNAPTMTGKVVWQSTDRDDVLLSNIAQIAVDAKQRVFVAESKENAILVYDVNGAYLTRFARKGAGPGEFDNPCCMTFDARGRLWVRDLNNARLVVFTLADNGKQVSAKPAFTVLTPGTSNFGVPIGFDAAGNVISHGHVPDADRPGELLVKRASLDTTGKVLRSLLEVAQTENITPAFRHKVAITGGAATLYLYQPYGAEKLRADGQNGSYALAGSGKYMVRWYSATGNPLSTITRDAVGVPLSARERQRGDSLMRAIAKRGQTTVSGLPFSLPDRKPPLSALFIDNDGRLWVQRTTADGAAHEADVYSPNGTPSFRAVWPANVRLDLAGRVRGNSAWGVALDGDDVPHIVRMEFSAAK